MNERISLFCELGERLAVFSADERSRAVMARACAANGWFTSQDILRAVEAVRREMLDAAKLDAWLDSYPLPVTEPRRVLVVMAGNIPLVGFFDLLCVLAAGHRCLVKPSGKDTVLMEYIVDALREIDPEASVAWYDGREPVDAVIATGSDNTNRYFRMRYAGLPTLLRGSRQSVAVLSGSETDEQLRRLSDDIFAYSGLGCRNVSLVLAPQGYEVVLQPPCMNPKYRNNYLQVKALLEMEGRSFRDLGTAVLTEGWAFPAALSRINYGYYGQLSEVAAWLADHDDALQCVVTECLDHPRRTGFGRAQWPTLTDYPDDRDVMEFLLHI